MVELDFLRKLEAEVLIQIFVQKCLLMFCPCVLDLLSLCCILNSCFSYCSYVLNSISEEREVVKSQKRKEYEKLQRRCQMLLKCGNGSTDNLEELPSEEANGQCVRFIDDYKTSEEMTNQDVVSAVNTDSSSDTDSCEDNEDVLLLPSFVQSDERKPEEGNESNNSEENSSPSVPADKIQLEVVVHEYFSTWQRIIRLDALRADSEWATYSSSSTAITESKARGLAESVGLKDYDHLESCRLYYDPLGYSLYHFHFSTNVKNETLFLLKCKVIVCTVFSTIVWIVYVQL